MSVYIGAPLLIESNAKLTDISNRILRTLASVPFSLCFQTNLRETRLVSRSKLLGGGSFVCCLICQVDELRWALERLKN